jgi:hypothetical protein
MFTDATTGKHMIRWHFPKGAGMAGESIGVPERTKKKAAQAACKIA